jgi:hypothetical protein
MMSNHCGYQHVYCHFGVHLTSIEAFGARHRVADRDVLHYLSQRSVLPIQGFVEACVLISQSKSNFQDSEI